MIIVHLHWEFLPTCGGVESHLETLTDGLGKKTKTYLINGTVNCNELSNTETLYNPILDLTMNLESAIKMGKNDLLKFFKKADIIHFHNLHYFDRDRALYLQDLVNKESSCVKFHTIHESWDDGVHAEILDWEGWDKQLVISDFILKSLRSNGFLREFHKITYAHDYKFLARNDMERARTKLGLPIEKFIITHPSRILPWKGADVAINSFIELNKRYSNLLLFITDTPNILDWKGEVENYREKIFSELSISSASENVIVKRVSRKDIPVLFFASNIIIYPTTGEEPFGLVPVEAIAARRVPIVSKSGGLTETVDHDVNGIVIENKNELKIAIEKVYQNKKYRKKLVEGGKAVRDKYSPTEMIKQHLDLYNLFLK